MSTVHSKIVKMKKSFPDILQETQMRVCTPQETQDPNTGQSVLEDYQICFRSIGETGSSAYRVRKEMILSVFCVRCRV